MRKFVWGMLIGAGVALLYAPATGRRTRSLIRDRATKVKNDIEDFAEGKGRHIQNKMEGYKARARGMAEDLRMAMAPSGQGDMGSTEPSI